MTCSKCPKPIHARGFCITHYMAFMRSDEFIKVYIPTPEERYEKLIDRSNKNGCHIWIGNRNNKMGYGRFRVQNRLELAHRFGYELKYGKIPVGYMVLHKCDNPPCQNSKHWFIGTAKDNMTDMIKKGRGNKARGEQNNLSKLTEKQVIEIRKRYISEKITHRKLASEYGVTHSTIGDIIRKNIWSHI